MPIVIALGLVAFLALTGCKRDESSSPATRETPTTRDTAPTRQTDPTREWPAPEDLVNATHRKRAKNSRCLAKANQVIREIKKCGLKLRAERTAEMICAELFSQDFTDQDAIRKLDSDMNDGCNGLGIEVRADHI